jgi:hypothetical protein
MVRQYLHRFQPVRKLHRPVICQERHQIAVERDPRHFCAVSAIACNPGILDIRRGVPALLVCRVESEPDERMPSRCPAVENTDRRRIRWRRHNPFRHFIDPVPLFVRCHFHEAGRSIARKPELGHGIGIRDNATHSFGRGEREQYLALGKRGQRHAALGFSEESSARRRLAVR